LNGNLRDRGDERARGSGMGSASTNRYRLLVLGAVVAAIVIAVILLPSGMPTARPGQLRVVCTFLPNYVFARNVVQGVPGVDLHLLLSTNLGCPHDYTVTPADLKAVAQADVIVANGLGLEPFLDDLRRANPKAKVVLISGDCDVLEAETEHHHAHKETENLSHLGATGSLPARALADKPLDMSSGREPPVAPEPGEEHHDDHEGHAETQSTTAHADEHDEHELNPHVWVSPVQAIRQVRSLARQMSEIDPARAESYRANADAFITRVESIHHAMLEAAAGFTNRRIVTFHDAFAYLARDLNLEVVATLTLDPSNPPSAQDMAHIIETIRETRAAAVFYEPAYSDRVARTIGRDAGVPVFPLNPFNSLDAVPTERSYENVMRRNLETLKQALGTKP